MKKQAISLVRPAVCPFSFWGRSIATEARAATFQTHGRPSKVLKITNSGVESLGPNGVAVKMIAAPVHPADLNIVEGTYPLVPKLPAVPGIEGVGEVVEVGSAVQGLSKEDWVIPATAALGTWRTHLVCEANQLRKVKKNIKAEYAATASINPCTALRLLEDFVSLQEGDVVIQNGGNSSVGQSVLQLAHLKGVKTINIIRDRPDFTATVDRMKAYGAYLVVPDSLVGTPEWRNLISDLPSPKLALNGVGGKTATEMARTLGEDGVMVTYGAMSNKPVQVPSSLLLFKNIQLKGFWLSKWVAEHSTAENQQMLDNVWDLIKTKKLRMWMERYPFSTDFDLALKRATEKQRNRKVVLMLQE